MPESDLDLLVRAARAAGEIAGRFFRGSYWTRDKGGADGPVTEADHAVNDLLAAMLRSARPEYGWLSEETPDGPGRLSAGRVFILDPIDGTRAFIDGNPDFAHSLAVAEGGKVIAGVVFLPMRDRLYSASTERDSALNGQPIRCSARTGLDRASVLTARSSLDPSHWKTGASPGFVRSFRPSLATRMALVADGTHDAMMTLRPAWEWDIAAGSLICARAGAEVSDRSGARLRFNTPGAKADGVIAAGAGLWREIVEGLG